MDVSDIISELDDHGFTDASDARKLAVINETYYDVCGREPWPFLEQKVQLTFDGTSPIPTNVPDDLHAVVACQIDNSMSGGRVQHMRYDDFLQRHNFSSDASRTGRPMQFYWPTGAPSDLSFWPIPMASVTVTMSYIATPTELDDSTAEADILLPKQYHRAVLVNGSIYKLDAMEDDLDIASGFQQFYEAAITRMRDWIWRRQYDKPDVVHPVDMDDMGGGGMFDISSFGG